MCVQVHFSVHLLCALMQIYKFVCVCVCVCVSVFVLKEDRVF